ncbi:phage terminase large subunit [Schinkia azotoformans]|uniref:phage terminase large subunit n=1 Tax=Schinkia azotoformans TaxID=1454 RepID=UPI002DB62E69|nr:phage terminase large subunit [Schinkia azotoformans]MEC1772826.1 phage terminase large subunit [Schinkia azotoformans]MED4367455.1 phage terminase large subunit [Schinkia azotoformans]
MKTIDKQQKELLLHYLNKHFTESEIKELLLKFKNNLTGQTGLRKKLAFIDKTYFGKAYFPKYFNRKSPEFHEEIESHLDKMIDGEIKNICVVAPRGHSKSTLCSFKIPLYCLLFKIKPFILLVSANEDMSKEFLKSIRAELETNEAILEDFSNLKGDTWNTESLILSNDTAITVKGADSSLRGIKYKNHRPHLIISDDIQKDSNVASESKLQALKNWYYESLANTGDTYTSFLFVSTRMSEHDLVGEVMNNPTYFTLFYQAVIQFSEREDLWNEWEEIITDLSNPYRLSAGETFFEKHKEEMIKGTQVLWEDKNDYYDLMLKQIEIGHDAFSKELQNEPKSAKDKVFHEIIYYDSEINISELDEIVLTIDPSLAKSNRSDFSAITVLGKDKNGYLYVLEGDCRRLKPDALIQEVIRKLEKFPVNRIGIETVNFQALLKEQLKKELASNGYYIDIVEINSRSNKHNRIISMQPIIANGYVKFNALNKVYNQQILDYSSTAKNDDAPDSLEMAVTLMQKMKRIQSLDRRLLGL